MTGDNDAAIAGGLESVLTAGAMNTLRGRVPGRSLATFGFALARSPREPVRHAAKLASQLWSIGVGNDASAVQDRRFADPAWDENPVLRRVARGYLATCTAVENTVADSDVDWRTREKVRVFADNVLAAASPTNNPFLNPASVKRAVDTGGLSWVRGVRSLAADMASSPRIPTSVDGSGYRMGENIAATPGKVVRRGRLYELIQYEPTTETVSAVPTLFVASPVNKFYLLDLSPKASVVKSLLDRGHQPFVVSWVNPDKSHTDIGLDDYVAAIVEMLETVAAISGSETVHLLGLCGGGQLTFAAAGYLAAAGRQSLLATLTIGIAVVDFERGGTMGALTDRDAVERSIKIARKRGYFDGKDTAAMFAWIRPNEGIWASAVNNYLLGLKPTTFDLVYWSTDQTNLALTFGAQLSRITVSNGWVQPGAVRVLGLPLDPGAITVDTYVFGASTDHICPWPDTYRTRALLGGETTFVLARGGHAAVISKPPGSARASYRTSASTSPDPQVWLADSVDNAGSWWEHWEQWIAQRTPETTAAPSALGNDDYPPIGDAPGVNVRVRLT